MSKIVVKPIQYEGKKDEFMEEILETLSRNSEKKRIEEREKVIKSVLNNKKRIQKMNKNKNKINKFLINGFWIGVIILIIVWVKLVFISWGV